MYLCKFKVSTLVYCTYFYVRLRCIIIHLKYISSSITFLISHLQNYKIYIMLPIYYNLDYSIIIFLKLKVLFKEVEIHMLVTFLTTSYWYISCKYNRCITSMRRNITFILHIILGLACILYDSFKKDSY